MTLESERALTVPVSAFFPRTDAPGMAAFVVNDGHAVVTPVEVVARNGSEAWIRSGLSTGTVVIVYPPPTVRDGVRVKARKV